MSSYRGTADRPDKAKAIVGVVAVHAALAFVILTGLSVKAVQQAVEQLTTIRIAEPPPPPPVQPPPERAPQPHAIRRPEGAAAKKAEPSPIVAPEPKLPLPSPVAAAKVAGTGNAATSGAALAGNGSGAGGYGNGPGGGGTGGYVPARLIRNLSRGDYRLIASYGMRQGSAVLHLVVSERGVISGCRVLRSSGSAAVDGLICQLAGERMLFEPAYDSLHRPIAYQFDYFARWG